ncbi:methylmalonyl-CoA mutase family protein [Luteipulveratus flavus]|uniref:Methylmalonyl-CoA mutase family protein n=1 Tax=Luteipulveratus flavus TaxID=3031728 RepID=A0ABT6C3E6_9MICO|nr:methylmalonyl-CoA mutase family protein [Luteipulveratus sp. YIM 133296]MDF8263375.1 methylmalonyl-CoA mutase family protein [Luteipulveratus sp. YIM 133296]
MIALDDDAAPDRRQHWEHAVRAVLTRAGRDIGDGDLAAALDSDTLDGVVVHALAEPVRTDRGSVGEAPFTRGAPMPGGGWDARALLTAGSEQAARDAVEELEGGSTSLWVRADGAEAMTSALADVYLDLAPVVLDAVDVPVPELARALVDRAEHAGRALHARTNLGAEAFGAALRDGGSADLAATVEVARLAAGAGVRGVVVDATAAYDLGSTDVTELAFALAAGAEVLRALEDGGVDLPTALRLMEFRLSVSDDQLISIAKLRAARLLWSGLARAAGADAPSTLMHQHAVTARPMLTRYDSWTNLLRTTIAAFSAGVAGAEAVTVLPFDTALGEPERLGRRMARNISRLLIEESHLDAVADPAGGAHGIERLTDDLAAEAWDAFRQIEQDGGLRIALESGTIRRRIDEEAGERDRLVRTRRQPVTGVSEFPVAGETLPVRRPEPHPVRVRSWTHELEALRDDAAARPVVLAAIGAVAEHTARVGFASHLLTAGGVPVVSTGPTASAADVNEVIRESRSAVAVLAGSDAQYAKEGAAYVEALRDAGVTWVVLAGRPSAELEPRVDDHLAVGHDVVETVQRLRSRLDGEGAES